MAKNSKNKKASTEEMCRALQQRAHNLQCKAEFKEVCELLKQNPGLCNKVLRQLKSLLGQDATVGDSLGCGSGFMTSPGASQNETPVKRARMTSPCPSEAPSGFSASSLSTELFPEDHAESAGELSKCYTRIDTLSVSIMQYFLSTMEPISMSMHHLRALVQRGQRQLSKIHHQKLLECATGLPPSWSPTGALRDKEKCLKYLCHRNLQRGRRLQSVALPPNWEVDGIYSFEILDNGSINLRHKYTKQSIVLPEHLTENVKDKTKLQIQANFSEASARLTEGEEHPEGLDVQCISFLPEQIAVPHPAEYAAGPGAAPSLGASSDGDKHDAAVAIKQEPSSGSRAADPVAAALAKQVFAPEAVVVVEVDSQSQTQPMGDEDASGSAPAETQVPEGEDVDESAMEAPAPPSEQ